MFRVFQVFHFAFGPQNRSFLVQIRTNPKNRYPPTSAIKWVRKTPKKAIRPLVYIHVPVRQAIGVFFFGGADFFFAKRLFFRYGEGCEGRAKRATVGVTAKDNGGACFPLDFASCTRKGVSPHIPTVAAFFIRLMPRAPSYGFLPRPTEGRFAPRSNSINS